MTARIIDGKAIAQAVRSELSVRVQRLKGEGVTPGLAVVIVGEDPASKVYVRNKALACEQLGMHSEVHAMSADTSQPQIIAFLRKLNADPAIHGILVQFPLPGGLDRSQVITTISPEKDVDGLHPVNAGRLATGIGVPIVPCTPAGCMLLIREARSGDLAGLSAVVIGRSTLVGRPAAQLLLNHNCTVAIAHSRTRDLPSVVRGADIVIAVDVLTCGQTFWGTPSTLVGTFFQSAMLLIRSASRNQHYRADVVIEPQIAHIRPDEIGKRDELIDLGEKAALERIDEIKALIHAREAAAQPE